MSKKEEKLLHVNTTHGYQASSIDDFESDQLIPLLTGNEDEEDYEHDEELEVPLLPVRNTVLFPGVVIPITVGRQKAIKLVKKAYSGTKIIGIVAQQNNQMEDPGFNDLYKVGTLARILKLLVLPDGNTTIIVQGRRKFRAHELVKSTPYLVAKVRVVHDRFANPKSRETVALIQSLKDTAFKMLRLNPDIPQEAQMALENIQNPIFLTHFLSSNLNTEVKDKQMLLEISDGNDRATRLLEFMMREVQMLELKFEIQSKVHSDIDQQQRDYFLRQQMKILQDELGMDSADQEIDRMRFKADKKAWPQVAQDHFYKELNKISRMNPASAEYPIQLNYCEFILDLPWEKYSEDKLDLDRAQNILDKDHYGMEKVKERIIEYLAVLKLKKSIKGPILCLYGPPGVGKTSLGRSIAKALNRKYLRVSLGGLHDEAEIRGHRKTYIGAMPGRILQNIKKAGFSNPVFILDEIDKIGSDFRGDPASALLEVLDPEQNSTFMDNYLELEYDLSKVLFIATANTLDTLHPALRDRMEIIEVNGYSLEEKIQIAKQHLIPKQRKDHGLSAKHITFTDEGLKSLIEGYTAESGVRNLERKVAAIIRSVAKQVAMEKEYQKKITPERIEQILGAPDFIKEEYHEGDLAGVVTGLAWTQVGGEILTIESSLSKGKGRLTLSGQLGDVMKESAAAALSFLKANADILNIDYQLFDAYDLHIHVPAGAVPKDGPSAGITMLTSIASAFTQRKVKPYLAMTGEITLTGKVLPVGGIKEKLLAAKRAGMKEIIFCYRNRKDVEEIPARYREGLTFHYVAQAQEVLEIALLTELVRKPIKLEVPTTAKSGDEAAK